MKPIVATSFPAGGEKTRQWLDGYVGLKEDSWAILKCIPVSMGTVD